MKEEKVAIELPNKMVVLILTPFDMDVDIKSLLEVQHHNIYGELVTISRLMNMVGNMKAEMQEVLSQTKLDFDIFEAQQQEKQRKKLTTHTELAKGGTKVDKPTAAEVENAVLTSAEYKVKKHHLFSIQKNYDYIESFFESVKNKSFVVMKISDKFSPEEFEKNIVEGSVNGIMIKINKKAIK